MGKLKKTKQHRPLVGGSFRDVSCPYCGEVFPEAHKSGACQLWRHVTASHALMRVLVGPLECPCGYKTTDDYLEASASNRIHWLYEHCCRLSQDDVDLHILLFSMGAELRNIETTKDSFRV